MASAVAAGDLKQDSDMVIVPTPGGCPTTGVVNAGPASAIALNQVKTLTDAQGQRLFVCHDTSGLYGLSSICPHQGCEVSYQTQTHGFYCPCHGSIFSYSGANTSGPAAGQPLPKLTVCIDANGNAIVENG